MVKNKGKGGKNRKKGKGSVMVNRELLKKEEGQEYGQVIKLAGNCRMEILCFDGTHRLGHIRGKIQKRMWMGKDDLVLVGLRDFQDKKCDVIYRYNLQEAQTLKRIGELPAKFNIETVNDKDSEDDMSLDTGSDQIDFSSDISSDADSDSSSSIDHYLSSL